MQVMELTQGNVSLILDKFDKEVDSEGFIIDKETKERVRCKFTDKELTASNLGGILPGSNIFIADDDIAYARYVAEFLVKDD